MDASSYTRSKLLAIVRSQKVVLDSRKLKHPSKYSLYVAGQYSHDESNDTVQKEVDCIGVFPTNQVLFGSVTCDDTTCITENSQLPQFKINAIPGTSQTVDLGISVCMVNCTNSAVRVTSNQNIPSEFTTIPAGYAVVYGPADVNISSTYTFTSAP